MSQCECGQEIFDEECVQLSDALQAMVEERDAANAAYEAMQLQRDEWTNTAVQRGLEVEDMRETNAALRAQNAELVAALKDARPFVEAETDEDLYKDLGGQHAAEWKERGKAAYIALAAIDAALAVAGQPQGSGE